MYDFDLLEKRCKRYYLKKYTLFFLLFITFLTLVVTLILSFNNEKTVVYTKSTLEKKQIVKKKAVLQEKVHVQEKIKTPITPTQRNIKKEKDTQIKENMCYSLQFFVAKDIGIKYLHSKESKLKKLGFNCYIHKGKSLLHLLCGQTNDYNVFLKLKESATQHNLDYVVRKVQCSEKQYQPKKIKKAEKISVSVQPIANKEDTFILDSQQFNPTYFKKLFQERKSYNISLKLAQYYYRMKDYKNAIEWAKKANGIDKTDAESWIIYAKSLYVLDDKKKAKKILHIYLQFENSKQVNKILSKWNNT